MAVAPTTVSSVAFRRSRNMAKRAVYDRTRRPRRTCETQSSASRSARRGLKLFWTESVVAEGARPGIEAALDSDVFASSPRDHRGSGRSAATLTSRERHWICGVFL